MKFKISLLGAFLATILLLTGVKVDAASGGGVDWTSGSGVLTGTGISDRASEKNLGAYCGNSRRSTQTCRGG